MLKLVIEDDEGQKRVEPFLREEVTIGREEGNTILLPERNVSRRHARLFRHNGSVLVEDLGSYNGTRINGEKIHGQATIRAGDLLQIGDYDLALQLDGAVTVVGPPPPPPMTLELPVITAPGGPDDRNTLELPVISDEAQIPDATASAEEILIHSPSDLTARAGAQPPPLMRTASRELATFEQPRLVILNSELAGQEHYCRRSEVSLGRTAENDVSLDHRSLSRFHAKLVMDEVDRWRIMDLQSANGVRVNGHPVSQQALEFGDRLELGGVQLAFQAPLDAGVLSAEEQVPQRFKPQRRSALPVVLLLLLLGIAAGAAYLMRAGVLPNPLLPPQQSPPESLAVATPPKVIPSMEPLPLSPERELKLRVAREAVAMKKFEKAKDAIDSLRTEEGALPEPALELLAQVEMELAARQSLNAASKLLASNKLEDAAALLEQSNGTVAYAQERQAMIAKLQGLSQRRANAKEHRPPALPRVPEKPAAPQANIGGPDKLAEEGFILLKGKQYDRALSTLKRCIEMDAAFARCHKGLGAAYAKLREPEKGAFHYRRYVQLAPNDEDAAKVRQYLDVYESSKKSTSSN